MPNHNPETEAIFNISRFHFNGTALFTSIRYAPFAVILQPKKLGKMRATFKVLFYVWKKLTDRKQTKELSFLAFRVVELAKGAYT